MSDTFQKTLDNLPKVFSHNAKALMGRLVAKMLQQLERDSQIGNASYLALLLKMGTSDLSVGFEKAVNALMENAAGAGDTVSGGLSLEIDMPGGGQPDLTMQASEAEFRTLQKRARLAGVSNLEAYAAKSLIECATDAMAAARINHSDIETLKPVLRRALNSELLAIYQKLNGL